MDGGPEQEPIEVGVGVGAGFGSVGLHLKSVFLSGVFTSSRTWPTLRSQSLQDPQGLTCQSIRTQKIKDTVNELLSCVTDSLKVHLKPT